MVRHSHRSRFVAVALLSVLAFNSCGGAKSTGSSTADNGDAEKSGENRQLKGVGLLAQSLFLTLGARKDVTDEKNEDGSTVSLFDKYSANFGSTEGLRFGEVYADTASANYFLALTVVAYNAAKRCQLEVLGEQSDTLCRCQTPAEAQAMLTRAMPFVDFAQVDNQTLATDFSTRCNEDYVGAVSALVSSLGFAIRK